MKIVVLGLRGFPDVQGGVETHCENLYTRMAARGHEVIVLGRKPYMRVGITEYKGVKLMPLMCPKQKFLEAFLHTLIGILKARSLNPDIVHIHAIGPSLMTPVARLLGLKVVTTNHGPDYDRQKWNGFAKKILKTGEAFGRRFSNQVIAISEPIADHLRKTFNCRPAVIPNGVVIRRPSAGEETLKSFGLERGWYILAVGRLVPEKGFHDLLEAFQKAQIPGWKLVIAGRADHEDAYSLALQRQAECISNVVMTGFITGDPLRELYSHAGLFVLPSYHEGLPIVLLEAMSYGLPVLASDIPANKQAGLPKERFFETGNIQSLQEKMIRYTLTPFSEAEKLAQIDIVRQQFDWDMITEKTLDVYESVVRKTPITV